MTNSKPADPAKYAAHHAIETWIPDTSPTGPFFGLKRDEPVMRSRYELTRWTRARWWLARKIEWLACLVGGREWAP